MAGEAGSVLGGGGPSEPGRVAKGVAELRSVDEELLRDAPTNDARPAHTAELVGGDGGVRQLANGRLGIPYRDGKERCGQRGRGG